MSTSAGGSAGLAEAGDASMEVEEEAAEIGAAEEGREDDRRLRRCS
jgi:hypothetical protein